MPQINVADNDVQLSERMAEDIAGSIKHTLIRKDDFTLVLAGGTTPRRLYERLAAPPYDKEVPWSRVKFFWTDERFVAPDHTDSNYRMAHEALISRVRVPEANVHPLLTGGGDLDKAALDNENHLKYIFHTIPRFDMVLLGLGEDGHVASLFPNTPSLAEEERWVLPISRSPKPPSKRLTMTFPLINNAFRVVVLVSGERKQEIVRKILTEPLGRYPAQYIWPSWGTVTWWADRAAYPEGPDEGKPEGGG